MSARNGHKSSSYPVWMEISFNAIYSRLHIHTCVSTPLIQFLLTFTLLSDFRDVGKHSHIRSYPPYHSGERNTVSLKNFWNARPLTDRLLVFQERNGEGWPRRTEGRTSRKPRGWGSYTCKNIRTTSTDRGVGNTRNGPQGHPPLRRPRPTPRAIGPILPVPRFIIPCKSISSLGSYRFFKIIRPRPAN